MYKTTNFDPRLELKYNACLNARSEFSDPSMGTRILEYTCIICYCDL